MHQNYYFLKQLAPKLHNALAGKRFLEAFSQEKDELILVFGQPGEEGELAEPFFVKATLTSQFSCLSFPDRFDRARRNSVNLFTDFENLLVASVRVFENERAIRVDFETGETLVFKLFGNRSNVISFDKEGSILQIFNNKLTADRDLTLSVLNKKLDQSFNAFVNADLRHEKLFPTFGKEVNAQLEPALKAAGSPEAKWEVVQNMLRQLEAGDFYLTKIDLIPALMLFETGEVMEHFQDPVEALNAFYISYIRQSGIEREKGSCLRLLRKRLNQTENYLENTFAKLIELESATKHDEIGNIIMANLHQIPERAEKVELYDFYRDQPITVRLKKDLTAQKNAENYYRKSKNEKIELARLSESLEARETEKAALKEHLEKISEIEHLRELRAYIKSHGLGQGKKETADEDLFKIVDFMNYKILIGRNAKNNDVLTKQYAHKEDLWLHAKDVTGSHVVVKNQPGKKFPAPVIERAAELAAFYSKRKNDSLCPVTVTPKKYVRKPKGLPEGAVVIDKEDVVLVTPRL